MLWRGDPAARGPDRGHCLYTFEDGPPRFLDDFEFVPAFDRGRAPFGRWDWDRVIVTTAWQNGTGSFPNPADFGLIVTRDRRIGGRNQALGDLTGWLGWSTFDTFGQHVTVLSYPGNLDNGERMHRTDAETRRLNRFAARIGTYNGNGSSGGPWVVDFGIDVSGHPVDDNFVVGVVSFGRGEASDPQAEGTSVLNNQFTRILDQACGLRPGNCER